VADAKRLLVLTRDRAGASFRQRIEPYLGPLAARGIAAKVVQLPPGALARREILQRARQADAVLLHRKTLTAWDAWALGGPAVRGPLVYDFDDAVMFQARAPDRPHPGRVRRFRRTLAGAALALAGSPELARRAREAAAPRVEVVPTGLDTGRYTPKATYAAAGPVRLVWIGSASTLKQFEASGVVAALRQVRAAVVLRIIADAALEAPGLAVENVAWSLEAEARLLAEADVGIAPLPDTPYTRGKCGFKILQYMAAGLPVVASPVGASADYVRPDTTGLHAAGPAAWAAAIERLAADAALRQAMGRAGRTRVEREFDFAVLAPRVCGLVEAVLATRRRV